MEKRVASLFACVGVAMLAVAASLYAHDRRFRAQAIETRGTVIALERVLSENGHTYKPVVRFHAGGGGLEGQPREFRPSRSSNPAAYAIGEEVAVFYDPADPGRAQIGGWLAHWGTVTVVGGMGAIFAGIGGGLLVSARGARQEKARPLGR